MSVGNLRDNGNKGNNLPYQLSVLQLLEKIATGTGSAPVVRVPTMTRENTAGVVAAGKLSVSFYNAGAVSATVLGTPLKTGEQVTFSVISANDTVGAIAYDATGTELLITTIQ